MERFKGFGGSGNGRKGLKLLITRHSLCSEGLNLIVLGTQGRVSDGDQVNLPASHPDRSWGISNQKMTKLLANGVAPFALFIGENCNNFERFCYCLIGHFTIF